MVDPEASIDPADEMRQHLMEMADRLLPIYEFAEGQKAILVARGWSESTAEEAAASIMQSMLCMALG